MNEPQNNDSSGLTETVASWVDYLENHFEIIYETVFRPRGYSRDTALVVYTLNKIYNCMPESEEDEEDDDTPDA